ncbi:hypothetical protein T08_8629 [Trichinella sp. T8]|nr:hypothetical protein T08_8629 [Trichinella sp. T8]
MFRIWLDAIGAIRARQHLHHREQCCFTLLVTFLRRLALLLVLYFAALIVWLGYFGKYFE